MGHWHVAHLAQPGLEPLWRLHLGRHLTGSNPPGAGVALAGVEEGLKGKPLAPGNLQGKTVPLFDPAGGIEAAHGSRKPGPDRLIHEHLRWRKGTALCRPPIVYSPDVEIPSYKKRP